MTLRPGEGVLPLIYAANHDPDVFPEPQEFDIERDARRHLAFGHGPHLCIGQYLARIMIEVTFGTLFRRIPDLRLQVPVEDLPFKKDSTIYGLHRLPVVWWAKPSGRLPRSPSSPPPPPPALASLSSSDGLRVEYVASDAVPDAAC